MSADEPRQERVWLAAGSLIGVIVAGVVIVALVVSQGGDGGDTRGPVTAPTTTSATSDVPEQLARARDDALKAAEEGVLALHTLDPKTAQDSITRWESVSTSPLLELLRIKHAENVALYSGSKTSISGKVIASAVARMAGDGSSADVLLHVEVSTTDAKGTTVQQKREKATMIQTADGWKVSVHLPIEPPA